MNFGVDRYKRPQKISLAEEKRRQKAREDYLQTQVNELWRTLPKQHKATGIEDRRYPAEPQENILYFIEKNAPCWNPGSEKWCASCARSASTSTRRSRPR